MTKLSTQQQQVLDHARSHGGRVYAADYASPNAQGRGGPARALASFYRTVNALVSRGLLRQLTHERWSVQGWELVTPVAESPATVAEPTDTTMTPGMVDFFQYRFQHNVLRRDFHTGRNGSCSPQVARALERRGWAVQTREQTWETHWRVTDAGEAAWRAHLVAQA